MFKYTYPLPLQVVSAPPAGDHLLSFLFERSISFDLMSIIFEVWLFFWLPAQKIISELM